MDTQTTTAKEKTRIDVYAIINDRIIEQLEKGTVPWCKPWSTGGLPMNIISKRHYRGINMMLLAMEGYEHNQFLSFKQVGDIGGKVKKGEKGHIVVYWSQIENKQEQKPEPIAQSEENAEQKKKAILRYYYVFNIAQCENIPEKYLPKVRETSDLLPCESIVRGMPQCPPIRHKEQRAFYNFKEDFVNMPKKRSFKNDESYYSTLFHELVHSTGHESRLKRDTLEHMSEFGGETYSLEELIAEMGTCYLQSFAGITSEFEQSAAYLQGWLGKLKNDKRFIFQAAKAAQRATDFILNVKDAEEDQQKAE
jgi:antirestriction protein ArdC